MNSDQNKENDSEIRSKVLKILEQWEKDLIQLDKEKELEEGDVNESSQRNNNE